MPPSNETEESTVTRGWPASLETISTVTEPSDAAPKGRLASPCASTLGERGTEYSASASSRVGLSASPCPGAPENWSSHFPLSSGERAGSAVGFVDERAMITSVISICWLSEGALARPSLPIAVTNCSLSEGEASADESAAVAHGSPARGEAMRKAGPMANASASAGVASSGIFRTGQLSRTSLGRRPGPQLDYTCVLNMGWCAVSVPRHSLQLYCTAVQDPRAGARPATCDRHARCPGRLLLLAGP